MHKPRRRNTWEKHRLLPTDRSNSERVGRLPPESKVNMAIEMTDAMVQVCVEGMRAQNPTMTEEECMKKLRERFEWARQRQKRGRPVQ